MVKYKEEEDEEEDGKRYIEMTRQREEEANYQHAELELYIHNWKEI